MGKENQRPWKEKIRGGIGTSRKFLLSSWEIMYASYAKLIGYKIAKPPLLLVSLSFSVDNGVSGRKTVLLFPICYMNVYS